MEDMNFLKENAKEFGIYLSDRQLMQFHDYYYILNEWNHKLNLTAITDFQDVMIKHFLDSISIFKFIDFSQNDKLIDVGTGAGFPGIPIKIVFPGIHVTLLDSLNKRIIFLDELIHDLDLSGIETIHGRAEEIGRKKEYRESYDFAVSRAVANLNSLSEICLPFLKNGGKFISYKSEHAGEEVSSAMDVFSLLGGTFKNCFHFYLPRSDFERNLILVDKVSSVPDRYPRKPGKPFKDPL